ncbi:hypothetical protein JXB68_003200 [Escherichia coli]|nr:hypothetical protein [Escherichia coli]
MSDSSLTSPSVVLISGSMPRKDLQKAALLFVTKSKKAFSLMSSIAVHPEPAALPTHGLKTRRSSMGL